VAYTVANVTLFGLVAMLFYPYLAHALFGAASGAVGLFLGTGIHDTSQVMGASLSYKELFRDERALQVATVTKLTRNVFLVAVVAGARLQARAPHGPRRTPRPDRAALPPLRARLPGHGRRPIARGCLARFRRSRSRNLGRRFLAWRHANRRRVVGRGGARHGDGRRRSLDRSASLPRSRMEASLPGRPLGPPRRGWWRSFWRPSSVPAFSDRSQRSSAGLGRRSPTRGASRRAAPFRPCARSCRSRRPARGRYGRG
jgi:hypothetical protein